MTMTKPLDLQISGAGYCWVLSQDGKILPGQSTSYDTAALRANRLEAAARRSTRPCLRCGHSFESHGPGNRLCAGCRRFADTAML